MAKRSQRRPSRNERAQAGCVWSLISLFAFRHGRSTRRLLSNRKQPDSETIGIEESSTQITFPCQAENCEDVMHLATADAAKTSVKELMEVEMFNELSSTNQQNDSEISLDQNSKYKHHTNNNQRRRNRSFSVFDAKEILPENLNEVHEQKQFSDDLDLEKIVDELSQIRQRKIDCVKNDKHCNLDVPSGQAVTVIEEKLAAIIKMVIEGRLGSSEHFGEEGNTVHSKDFTDALQRLSLNKGSFLKLLQDSNSTLVKHIQSLEDAQVDKDGTLSTLSESNLSKEKPVNLKSDECSSRRPRNFFRRRSKSMGSSPLGGNKDSQSPNKLVVLKPGSACSQIPQTGIATSNSSLQSHFIGKAQNDRNSSHFSFTEIKRRLRNAMGKDRQGVPFDRPIPKFPPKHQNGNNGNKGAAGETLGWSSPNRNHFYTEKFRVSSPKKGEPVNKVKEKGAVVNDTCQYPQVGGSNIYIEAKKHLSEMLENGEENAVSRAGLLPKSLGRILSLPEYNGSTCSSPRNRDEGIFITAQMRLSPRGTVKNNMGGLLQGNLSDHPSPRRQNLENQSCDVDLVSQNKVPSLNASADVPIRDDIERQSELQFCTEDAIIPEDETPSLIVAVLEGKAASISQEEENISTSINSESSCASFEGGSPKEGFSEVDNEESTSKILKESSEWFDSDSYGEDQRSPPHSPISNKVKYSDHGNCKMELPSPISILEPLFTDDDISPASTTMSRPAEKVIQPRQINFEEQSNASEQGICTRISLEGEESAFEYVEAVLLGSGLNWDDFLSRWLSSYDILDSNLFDEVELFSSRPRHDQKLLFDCANESLKKVCEYYFGCFTGISQDKPNTRPVPIGMDLIHEIWKQVEDYLLQYPIPLSLDQLVKLDLAKSGKWLFLQSDIELIGSEMEETILDEFMDDFIMSFIIDMSEMASSVLQAEPETEPQAIEATHHVEH